MTFRIFFLLSFLFSIEAIAAFKVDVSLINRRGIDKGLVLVSEVHSTEIIELGHWVGIKMKSGPFLKLMAQLKVSDENMGPSANLDFWWELQDQYGKVIKEKTSIGVTVPLGKKHTIIQSGEVAGQQIEIVLYPRPL